MNRWSIVTFRRTLGMAFALLAVLAISACGGSGSTSGTNSEAGASTEATASTGLDQAALEKKLQPYLTPPKEIEVTEPLKSLPTGKTMAFLECSAGPCRETSEGFEKAARSLGLRYHAIQTGQTPESFQAAAQQAVEEEPDAVVIDAIEPSEIKTQLDEMHAKGIKVIGDSIQNVPPGAFDLNFISAKSTEEEGEALARYVILKSGGDAHLLYVDQSVFSFAPAYGAAMKRVLEAECSECKFSETDSLPEEVGTKIPSKIVSELQTDPSINWLTTAYGAMSLGLPQALEAAGLSDQVQVVSQSPEKNNYAAVKSGDEVMTLALNYEYFAYNMADSIARLLTGQKTPDLEDDGFSYMIEKGDVAGLDIATEVWNPVPGFQGQFERLWGVG